MDFLAFRLYAPLSSWGDVAVGEHRPSQAYPGRSAVLGLLAAALGIRRDQDESLAAMSRALGIAVAVYSSGTLLRDYHTTQVPSEKDLKKRPQRTRADELAVPKSDLNTILSTRDYREDALCVVLIWIKAEPPPQTLDALQAALLRPRFTLYLGRKSCPPACPLQPQIVHAISLWRALAEAKFVAIDGLSTDDRLQRLAWEEGVAHGLPGQPTIFSTPRKDDPRSRARWQFSDRIEWVGLPDGDAQVDVNVQPEVEEVS